MKVHPFSLTGVDESSWCSFAELLGLVGQGDLHDPGDVSGGSLHSDSMGRYQLSMNSGHKPLAPCLPTSHHMLCYHMLTKLATKPNYNSDAKLVCQLSASYPIQRTEHGQVQGKTTSCLTFFFFSPCRFLPLIAWLFCKSLVQNAVKAQVDTALLSMLGWSDSLSLHVIKLGKKKKY